MTWTAHCTVQDVGDGPAPIDVLLTASADETYTSQQVVRYDGSTAVYKAVELPCITSNTEGKIRAVEIRLQLEEDSTTLKVGDVVTVSGHFQGLVASAGSTGVAAPA